MYKIQKTLPNKGNKFYNTDSNGGYSWCIQGSPTIDGLNVLCNCVGWACGRFNEIYSIETGYKGMKYPQLCCNAEDFIRKAKQIGLQVQKEPTNGGIMVWEGKGDLKGHVALVENDIIHGKKVFTSESGYKNFDMRNYTRTNDNGNWGVNNYYTYLGCIVNPCNPKPEVDPQPTPTPGDYPFDGIVKKGAIFYNENGDMYPNPAIKDRYVVVQGEKKDMYKIFCQDLHPQIVYVHKDDVIRQQSDYPFNAIVKKGSPLYNKEGYKYQNGASANRHVIVRGEYNGRYEIYGETFAPHVVYCDKSSIIKI